MNLVKIVFVILSILGLSACCPKKNKTSAPSDKVITIENKSEKEMLEAGFTKASVLHFEHEKPPCDYLIEIEDSKILLEPQKELDAEFKVTKSLVWVKYQPQRRMSRCANSQPVGIITIEKRFN